MGASETGSIGENMKSHTGYFQENGIPHDINAIVAKHGKIDKWFHAKDMSMPFALLECGDTFYSVDTTDGKVAGYYPKRTIDRILKADLNACYVHLGEGEHREQPLP